MVQNVGNADFEASERLDYRINDEDPSIVAILTELAQGQSKNFTFNFDLPPGDHEISVILGESQTSDTITVEGADLALEVVDHRLKRGGEVEFDLEIANHGELTAKNIALSANWGDTPDDFIDTEVAFDDDEQGLLPNFTTISTLPIKVAPGAYRFTFDVSTATIEGQKDNNSASIELDVEFVDLRVSVQSSESLGWDGSGRAFMSMLINVENAGLDDSGPFVLGIECAAETIIECASSTEFESVPSGASSFGEVRVWMPVGETLTRVFAVEDEETFRWGELNAIDHTLDVSGAPDLVWNLTRISEPKVISYWSDGSANVDLDLTFVNNGVDETRSVLIQCVHADVVLADCGGEIDIQKVADVYPTVVEHTIRLPAGDMQLLFHYGDDEPIATPATVPERIVGIEREVWECFSDTSWLEVKFSGLWGDGTDQGIGCGGWEQEYIIKWPVGETINVWLTGDKLYTSIFEEVLEELAVFMNLEFEYVANKSDAQLQVYTGWPREDATTTGLDCVEYGGCAQRWQDDYVMTQAKIAIWYKTYTDETKRDHWIRAISLHELLHALTNGKHRHHDRTSVMSYDALSYTTIDGIDEGLFQLLAHPLVEPGMSFGEVLDLIVFSDELNDPPEQPQMSAQQLLRRAAATMIDAGSVRFEMKGDWPGCAGNHDFGPATHEIGNLRRGHQHWTRFDNGNEHYYIIAKPDEPHAPHDRELIEYWLNRGSRWERVGSDRIYNDDSAFRDYWSNPLDMLHHINIYGNPSNYNVVFRSSNLVILEIELGGPNPEWSRSVNVDIRIEMNPESFEISEYKMTWNFNPRSRDSCAIYEVRARGGVYGFEFKFPDEILERSRILD